MEEENESLGQQFRQEMLKKFQHMDENLKTYTKELLDFHSSLKDKINSVAAHQSQATDTSIKQISQDLVQQEITISEKLVNTANSNVSILVKN